MMKIRSISIDFNHTSESSTFAAQQTKVLPSGMSRILSWYDNEWGFSNRMADTAVAMGAFFVNKLFNLTS